MVNETIVGAAAETLTVPLDSLTTIIQALGGIIILYLAFSIANFIINWKKKKEIQKMKKDIQEIKKMLLKNKKSKKKGN
ncbi:MAG: hypothetical protein WDZ69_02750 [Candidatus Pacearchaeota archaeon]